VAVGRVGRPKSLPDQRLLSGWWFWIFLCCRVASSSFRQFHQIIYEPPHKPDEITKILVCPPSQDRRRDPHMSVIERVGQSTALGRDDGLIDARIRRVRFAFNQTQSLKFRNLPTDDGMIAADAVGEALESRHSGQRRTIPYHLPAKSFPGRGSFQGSGIDPVWAGAMLLALEDGFRPPSAHRSWIDGGRRLPTKGQQFAEDDQSGPFPRAVNYNSRRVKQLLKVRRLRISMMMSY